MTSDQYREMGDDGTIGRTTELQVFCFKNIIARAILWLWLNRIALGKVTVLAGEGGLGKSTILCDLAARTTTGTPWPDGQTNGVAGNVFILAAEDAADDTIKPRLAAHGADMSRVFYIAAVKEAAGAQRSFNLQADLQRLEEAILEKGGARLLIIDPISSYLGKVDSHKNAEVRSVLEPLGRFAERMGCAVLCNNHFSKGGGSANNRIIGSVAFVNQARGAFIVSPDADNPERLLFLPSKTNIGPKSDGLAYRIGGVIAQVDDQEIATAQVFWESGPVSMTADAALAAIDESGDDKSALDEACEFLEGVLGAGAKKAKEVEAIAKGHMISPRTLRRARERLGLEMTRDGFGADSSVSWKLPAHTWPSQAIDVQASDVVKYGKLGQVCDPADLPARVWEDSDLEIPDFLDRRGA